MAEFDADKLGKKLDEINQEYFTKIDNKLDKVFNELRTSKAGPKRAENFNFPANRLTG
mgnify:FL=1|tara:strand:+ start:548 stop:721 length:174 start_codon:yes stop_codon:yes gene_type:complete